MPPSLRAPRVSLRSTALTLAIVALGLPGAEARAEWQTVATEQGVEVSQQPVEGRDLPMFRGVGDVEASLSDILEVIGDVAEHTRWMPDCAESRLLREEGDVLYVYRRTSAPWPVSDRDVVIRSRTEVIETDVEVHVYFEAVDEPAVAPDSGAIRMPHLSGHYKLRALGPARTRVEYQVDVDPGGRLPGWLAAGTSRDNPIRTLVGLRAQLADRELAPVSATRR